MGWTLFFTGAALFALAYLGLCFAAYLWADKLITGIIA